MKKQSKLYLGTNTKMYKTIAQTVEFLSGLRDRTADISREELELFVIPSFTTLERARQTVTPEQIHLGAQNMGWEQEGQFSGEISPVMLKEVGMELVMIGHSERRHVLGETDEMENKKVLCALRNGLTPLLCIGETGEQKALGLSDEVQRTAGGIRLDTLFLDEGFGSLDEESLEQAMRVLAGLTEGDRLVGIISHVSALKDRIDRQVVVRKARTGGSTVELIV